MNPIEENDLLSHSIIRASAGTGKTFQLSNRFLAMLALGTEPDRILATTFTKKAAGEILERILERLARAASDPQESQLLAGFLGIPGGSQQLWNETLRRLTRNLHRLRVSTLDAFFAQIARSYSLELGLAPDWKIADTIDDLRMRREAVERVLLSDHEVGTGESGELKTLLNLLAKGDTTRSVETLIHDTVSDLYGTFCETSVEAWQNLPRPKPLDEHDLATAIGLLESVPLEGKRFLSARIEDVARARGNDWETFIEKGLSGKLVQGETLYYRKEIPGDLVDAYGPLIDHARAILLSRVVLQTESTYQLLEKFHCEFERAKQISQQLRFDDITNRLCDRLGTGNLRHLAFRLDGRIESLLLDEFQDTSLRQWQVVRPFAERVTDSESRGTFFCVGDVKQAIYGWRGGMAEIFDDLREQLPGVAEETLDQSRRSSPAVIETVNQVFAQMGRHPNLGDCQRAVRRWSSEFRPHTTALGDRAGYVSLETSPVVDLENETQAQSLNHFAARRIAQLASQHRQHSIGVLVRTNTAVARLVYLLRKMGVEASEEGGNTLDDSAAVETILSLLHLADHPGDTVARHHVAKSPLGPTLGLQSDGGAVQAERVAQNIRRQLQIQGYADTIDAWANVLSGHCNTRELTRLQQLVELACRYQAQATLRATDFVELVRTERIASQATSQVRVMTVHQSKGLEFDIVVLPELNKRIRGQSGEIVIGRDGPTGQITSVCRYAKSAIQQLLPPRIRRMFDEAVDRNVSEAMCVFYVAMTRAARSLYMIIPPAGGNERTVPKTIDGLLRAALVEDRAAPPDSILYELGRRDWSVTGESTAAGVVPQSPMLAVRLAKDEVAVGQSLRRSAASAHGPIKSIARSLRDSPSSLATRRGTLIHAWLEQVEWLSGTPSGGCPSRERLQKIAWRHSITGLDIEHEITSFLTKLVQDNIAKVFHAALSTGDAAVHREFRVSIREDGTLTSGIIDRLVLRREQDKLVAADIIDFKTDAIGAGDDLQLQERVDYHRPQLETYRRAVAHTFGLAPAQITARLLFWGPAELVDV